VLIAIGNSGDTELAPLALARLGHRSPLVRAMAVWALARLCDAQRFAGLAQTHRAREPDPEVAAEWRNRGFTDDAEGDPGGF
jgi:epoxyqueuosine reductase